ncbi:MAG: ATPase [Candidatus Symbiothrix sp.]|jgi:N-acetylglucosamine kinase-like BadF-type ATPase|nr:ATPase [Candidatus Symbiothrix sp.]
MLLIADSGSTKTTWAFIKSKSLIYTTSGMNPFFLSDTDLLHILQTELPLPDEPIDTLYFYGAGCTPEQQPKMAQCLSEYFHPKHLSVESDLLAAARSQCQQTAGIVGILGTGSNSCRFDGEKIVEHIAPLGYILGDEGSGADLGKHLIADILKQQLPSEIIRNFHEQYPQTTADILEKVYRQPYPNRFLAQFSPFLASHIDYPEMASLVERRFDSFVKRNLLLYPDAHNLPIHFVGSIAFVFRRQLEKIMRRHYLRLAAIHQTPMEGLIQWHKLVISG